MLICGEKLLFSSHTEPHLVTVQGILIKITVYFMCFWKILLVSQCETHCVGLKHQ